MLPPATCPARPGLTSAAPTVVGERPALGRALAIMSRAATTDVSVLVLGETGTGKELAARLIHARSPRAGGPFVAVNCAALPEHLVESELFGHEAGAFTGAVKRRLGRFEQASGGTLFLDEIGDLPMAAQAKLLRALQERVIERLGGGEAIAVDVRVIAATHRDLAADIAARGFRSDLYYRLSVVTTRLPALRERPGDVARHRWPGNVRELRNYLERCAALGVELAPRPAAVDEPAGPAGPAIDASTPLRDARERWTTYFERAYLDDLLRRHGDNLTVAARTAGIDRAHLYRLLWKHGLR